MHKCKNCVRYHPKAVGNCRMAQSWANLEKQHGFTLVVIDCPHYVEPEVVFGMEWTAEEPKPKKTRRKKKADVVECCEDRAKFGECECEGDG